MSDSDIKVINAAGAPPAIGPYSQGIRAGNFVFVSGQVPVDAKTGKLVEGIEAQTKQCLHNMSLILEAAGSSLKQVVKVTIFLAKWEDFKPMNETYAKYFTERPPARSVIQGDRIPPGTLVGMEAIATVG